MMNDAPTCRWSHDLEVRAIPGRHQEACEGAGPNWEPGLPWIVCPGCLECPQPHCRACHREHAEGACPRCLAETRETLAVIEDLCLRLPWEAVNLAGRNSAPGRNVLGGDPMVLLAHGSDASARAWARERGDDVTHAKDERVGDPTPPELVLTSQEDDGRRALGHPLRETPTLGGAIAYLDEHLDELAACEDMPFGDTVSELNALRGSLEGVLADGVRPQRGAPCVQCGRIMRRVERKRETHRDPKVPTLVGLGIPERRPSYDFIGPMPERTRVTTARPGNEREGAQDAYYCDRCDRVVSEDQYRYAVGVAYRTHAKALTVSDLMLQYDVKRGSITGWAAKGLVRKRGKSADGRQLYDVADVVRMLHGDDHEDETIEETA